MFKSISKKQGLVGKPGIVFEKKSKKSKNSKTVSQKKYTNLKNLNKPKKVAFLEKNSLQATLFTFLKFYPNFGKNTKKQNKKLLMGKIA